MAATCRTCGAPILWARTEHGRRMPLDVEPAGADVAYGFVLRERDNREGPLAIAAPRAAMPDDELYVSHFATCPDADTHRRS